jgi:ubiquinone biosynthesis protein UbiJ
MGWRNELERAQADGRRDAAEGRALSPFLKGSPYQREVAIDGVYRAAFMAERERIDRVTLDVIQRRRVLDGLHVAIDRLSDRIDRLEQQMALQHQDDD